MHIQIPGSKRACSDEKRAWPSLPIPIDQKRQNAKKLCPHQPANRRRESNSMLKFHTTLDTFAADGEDCTHFEEWQSTNYDDDFANFYSFPISTLRDHHCK